MDKLVAQYSRPQHQNEFYSEAEQQELTEGMPPLSLKFALPPVDNVSVFDFIDRFYLSQEDGDAIRSPLTDRPSKHVTTALRQRSFLNTTSPR
jgi:hypothetical protein